MAVDGTWNISMQTPMGERKATLDIKASGNTLTGKQAAEGGSAQLPPGGSPAAGMGPRPRHSRRAFSSVSTRS